jgi:hypothetical protein
MTMKSAFYPLIGDKIFGWMGDLLDVISVATTLFGVCTSLGLGVQVGQLQSACIYDGPTAACVLPSRTLWPLQPHYSMPDHSMPDQSMPRYCWHSGCAWLWA